MLDFDNISINLDKNSPPILNNRELILYKRSALVIPRIYEGYSWYENIKNFLTRYIKIYGGSQSSYEIYKFFFEFKNCLLIPRYFPIQKFIFDKYILDENYANFEKINIKHDIKLRDEIQEKTVSYMLNNNKGIIKLSPGSGKTIISIYLIAEKKLKTIILCHRKNLVEQWKTRLLEFTSLTENDINIYDNIKNNNFDKSVTIVTDQTLLSGLKKDRKELIKKLKNSKNGIFIADEVHTSVGAQKFSECSCYIPSKITFGLSATPMRNDGTSDIIQFHLGNVYEPDIPDNKKRFSSANVTILLFNFFIINEKSRKYIYWGGNFSRARYLNYFKKCGILNKLSLLLLNKLINENKNIIFISERKQHISLLFDNLKYESKSKFIEDTTINELNFRVTFATPGKIRDGIDAPQKDSLLLTSPIGNIEQMVGRIERIFPGKDHISIIDMVDIGCYDIAATVYKRLRFYNNKKYNIKFIFLDSLSGKKKEIKYEEFNELIRKKY